MNNTNNNTKKRHQLFGDPPGKIRKIEETVHLRSTGFVLEPKDDPELMKGFDPNFRWNAPPRETRKTSDKILLPQLDMKIDVSEPWISDMFETWIISRGCEIPSSDEDVIGLKEHFLTDLGYIIDNKNLL